MFGLGFKVFWSISGRGFSSVFMKIIFVIRARLKMLLVIFCFRFFVIIFGVMCGYFFLYFFCCFVERFLGFLRLVIGKFFLKLIKMGLYLILFRLFRIILFFLMLLWTNLVLWTWRRVFVIFFIIFSYIVIVDMVILVSALEIVNVEFRFWRLWNCMVRRNGARLLYILKSNGRLGWLFSLLIIRVS